MEQSVEIVRFGEHKLYCPVINGEPHVVINKMIENIGLSYNNAMDSVNSSRFKKWTASLKITELKGENRQALWSVTFQKNGQKPEIFQFQHSVWQVIFSNLGGYEYSILPTRKLAG